MKTMQQSMRERINDNWRQACPACPLCQAPLISRPADRRFMEDNHYVECPHGHIFELRNVTDHPIWTTKEGGADDAISQQLAPEGERGFGPVHPPHREAER